MVSCLAPDWSLNNEFFFNPILSSTIIAETPNLSNVRIVNGKCSNLPPLSASNINGFVVTSNKSPNPANLEGKI